MKSVHHLSLFDLPFTCDVVKVVETVEVQAAGLSVSCVWTLPSHTGWAEGVRCSLSIVGSGAGLKKRLSIKKRSVQKMFLITASDRSWILMYCWPGPGHLFTESFCHWCLCILNNKRWKHCWIVFPNYTVLDYVYRRELSAIFIYLQWEGGGQDGWWV